MPADRFDWLEEGKPPKTAELPAPVKDALSRLSRFTALEIGLGGKGDPAPPSAAPAPAKPATPADRPKPVQRVEPVDKIPCVHCGQLNEKDRETCWACYRFVRVKAERPADAPAQDITLVLDGVQYRSNQADLPDDIRELMKRIQKQGYSQQLLADWRSWRATRRSPPPPSRPFTPDPVAPQSVDDQATGIQVTRGEVSVIRLDGKVYHSNDPDLTPELRQLFAYIEANGVTPALMEYLRQMGRVKVRPPTTAMPSDGDLAFWEHVRAERRNREAEGELERAQWRYQRARQNAIGGFVGVGVFILYILASIFLR